jgi:hypothetical protein
MNDDVEIVEMIAKMENRRGLKNLNLTKSNQNV